MQELDTVALAVLLVYMVIQLGIAFAANRFIKTEVDYLLGGRQLGLMLASFSLFATWFGAETVVASSGAIAGEGLSGGRAEPFGYTLCLVLFAVFISYRMRAKEYMTASDFYLNRFGIIPEKLSVLLVIPTSLIWAAAQIVAFAHILSSALGIDFELGLVAGTTLVVIYSMMGGFLGDVFTDLFQGVFVILGLIITAVFVVIYIGGIDEVFVRLTPERLNIINPEESFGLQIDEWMIAIVGSLVSQEAIARFLAAKSPKVARNSCYTAAGMYFIIGMIPAFIGLVGADLIPLTEDSDSFLPTLAKSVLPSYIYFMFLGALLSAILSTIDSTLLSVSALSGHNLLIPFFKKSFTREEDKVRLQRMLVLAAGFCTYLIASAGQGIYELIEMSSSFGSAGLLVCLMFGLWSRIGGIWSAIVTLVCGAVFAYVFQYVWEWEMGYIASIAACVVVYMAMAFLERLIKPAQMSHA